MKKLEKIDYVLIVEGIILAALLIFVIAKPSKPCTLSFEVHKGVNYNQPYPTYRHCGPGEMPEVVE